MFESFISQTRDWLAAAQSAFADDSALPAILSAAGVLLLTVWAMGSLRSRIRRRAEQAQRTSTSQPAAGARPSSASNHAARRDIESLMVDAQELTRRLAATLDNKAARVEVLLDRLECRLAESEARADLHAPPHHEPAQRDARQRRDHAQRRQRPVRAVSVPVGELEAGGPGDPLRDEVIRLADEGLPPVEIARKLNEQIGKVELILALRDA